jgi:hypothetical protein
MKITRNNYEIWFLDYLEGRLDPAGMEEVHHFLLDHPDLAEELEISPLCLSIDATLEYPGKELLKKSQFDDSVYFEDTVVAAMEGDLTEFQSSEFEAWLVKNPDKQADISRFQRVRLQPDTTLVFPQKERLKRKPSVKVPIFRLTAVAALLLLAFVLFRPGVRNPVPEQLSAVKISTAEKPATPGADNSNRIAGLSIKKAENKGRIISVQQKVPNGKPRAKTGPPEILSRKPETIERLASKAVFVQTEFIEYYDLVPIKPEPVYYASSDIPLSEYLNTKLKSIKDQGPKGFFSREEVAVAGLRFFSLLPGKHLTGKKGRDGKLKSITFNTQMLAISIPVNK